MRRDWSILVCVITIAVLAARAAGLCHAQDSDANVAGKETRSPSLDELLLFFPAKYPIGDWEPGNLTYTDVRFSADDQTRLHAWYCPCSEPRATILIAHGNAGNIATRTAWLSWLQSEAKIATFCFDYRGYGRSEGIPTVEGILKDARAARTELRRIAGLRDSEMFLMGESLGGAVVVQLAAGSAPRGLILQSTFSSLKEIAGVHYPALSWIVPPDKLNSADAITRYRGPLFQSHGTADRTIPFALAERLFQAAHEPKTFVRIPGADHNNWLTEDYRRQFTTFIAHLQSDAVVDRAPTGTDQTPAIGSQPASQNLEDTPSTATNDNPFRLAMIILLAAFLPFGVYRRFRTTTGEKLDRWQEGLFILFGLRLSGIPLAVGGLTWMINPQSMAWASISLLMGIRWLGVGLMACAGSLLVWTFHHLGNNLTDTVVTRINHTFVCSGPYRFVRHPFYVTFAIGVLGSCLLMSNWFILAAGALPLLFLVARTPIEEEKLIERFGTDYVNYTHRVGRFLPRFHADTTVDQTPGPDQEA